MATWNQSDNDTPSDAMLDQLRRSYPDLNIEGQAGLPVADDRTPSPRTVHGRVIITDRCGSGYTIDLHSDGITVRRHQHPSPDTAAVTTPAGQDSME